jgi:hypothetical protein
VYDTAREISFSADNEGEALEVEHGGQCLLSDQYGVRAEVLAPDGFTSHSRNTLRHCFNDYYPWTVSLEYLPADQKRELCQHMRY